MAKGVAYMRTAVFDLDGTLADTSGDLIAAANAALGAALLDPGADEDRLSAFRGGRAMLRLGLQRRGEGGDAAAVEAVVDALFPAFLDHYGAHIDVFTRLYAGVETALDALAARGWRLGVCTNKPEALALELLQRLGILPRFAALVGADTLAWRKPDPRPYRETVRRAGGIGGRSVLIGDTETDRETARAAGVPCVLVGFGPLGAGVAALAPAAVLDGYAALPELMDSLIAG